MAMEVEFTGQLTQQDFLRAQHLHMNLTPRVRLALWVVVVSLVIVMGYAAMVDLSLFITLLPIGLFVVFLIGFSIWLPRVQIASAWRQHKALHDPIYGAATAAGLRYNGAQFSGEIGWPMFLQYKRSDELVLLYQSGNAFNLVPRHAFRSDDDWRVFLAIVEQHVPAQASVGQAQRWLALSLIVLMLVAMGITAWTLLETR
jgi:hypothetical protein